MSENIITVTSPTWYAISVGDNDVDFRLVEDGSFDPQFLIRMGEYAKAQWNSTYPAQAWEGEVSYREVDCPPKEWLETSLESLKRDLDHLNRLYNRHRQYLEGF
jgi:hypothetical protein